MEFLLKSYKKNRNWVWLKQMLLLLSRITILILALLMLGQVGCDDDRVARLLGGATTHHYVLLDDSFSMNDRAVDGSAFDRALSTISMISARAKNRQNQKFTLLRYSALRPSLGNERTNENLDGASVADLADLNSHVVDNLFDQRLVEVKSQLQPTNLAVQLNDVLSPIEQLVSERDDENAIVYVLSDFREKDWSNPTEVAESITKIEEAGAAVELIRCVKNVRPNLAVSEVSAVGNVRVAGTPLMMQVTVKNCSDQSAEKVQVNLLTHEYDENPQGDSNPADVEPKYEDLPTIFIEKILPGESQTRQFPVFFNSMGQHVVQASLGDDSVANDNLAMTVVDFQSSARVLLIDHSQQLHSSFVALAISPGGMTGIEPVIKPKDYLRDATAQQLDDFDAMFLLDIDRLDESAIRNVEEFVRRGGGVSFFLGPNCNLSFYTSQLFRNGKGILPMPLDRVVTIPEQMDDRVPDINAVQHPIFAPMLGRKTSVLDLVQIKQIVQPPLEWTPPVEDTEILATVRGVKTWPLVIEKRFGQGKSVLFTTTAGPVWNNWMRNGTFPPVLLLLENELADGKYPYQRIVAGQPIVLKIPAKEFAPRITFVTPGGPDSSRMGSQMTVPTVGDYHQAMLGQNSTGGGLRETDITGVFDVWLNDSQGNKVVQRNSINADHLEGEMKLVNAQNLISQLRGANPTLVNWDQFNPEPKQKPASMLGRILLILLIVFLVVEQMLAYSCSYHSKPTLASQA